MAVPFDPSIPTNITIHNLFFIIYKNILYNHTYILYIRQILKLVRESIWKLLYGSDHMGLFGKSRKIKKESEWRLGLSHALLEFEDTYFKIITATSEDIIFYKDIMFLEQVGKIINFRTNVKRFSLISRQVNKLLSAREKRRKNTKQI